MGLIRDVGGKLAQSLLSIDDFVLGGGLASETRSQLGLTGRSIAGAAAVSANVAVRAAHAGIQAGAKTAGAAAAALEGLVPGAGLARKLARCLDDRSADAAAAASRLSSHALELTTGEPPRNPLTGEQWLSRGTPRGYGWGELAADTAAGSFAQLAAMPLALALDAAAMAAASPAARAAVESSLAGASMMIDVLPGTETTDLDAGEIREVLLAVTASAGDPQAQSVLALGEAAVRFALGDTRKLRRAILQAAEEMRRIAGRRDDDDLAGPIATTLKKRARRAACHVPEALLKALERGSGGEAPRPGAVLAAMLEDASNLLVFATEVPLVLALAGADAGNAVAAGLLDTGEIETWVRDHGTGDAEVSRPLSAAWLEARVGDGTGAAASVARDTAFAYSSEVLGREEALARAERLFGRNARERLEDDVSLELEILRADGGEARDGLIRDLVAATGGRELSRRCDACQRQLATLVAFSATLYDVEPGIVIDRRQILETFISLSWQDLALRGVGARERAERAAARESFDRWLESAAG